jgi:glycosyltransferase involved in cell wall biosynthesis
MWGGKRVSLVFPTFNEKDSIRAVIEEFHATGVVDEIVVVNNNAAAGTSAEVARTCAREVHEPRQGYGAAIRRGFREVDGDYVIVAEPDGTFRGRDVRKLLAYAEDFDVVYGSRTVKELIWDGANMGLFLKWGNYAVAKLMEFLFNTTSLTDVGCTVRCVRRDTLRQLEPLFTVDGSFFGPEMMLLSILQRRRIIQVPVNYTRRTGVSSVTGNRWVAFGLGLRMIALILEYRLRSWLSPAGFAAAPPPPGAPTLGTVDVVTEPYDEEEEKAR